MEKYLPALVVNGHILDQANVVPFDTPGDALNYAQNVMLPGHGHLVRAGNLQPAHTIDVLVTVLFPDTPPAPQP